MGESEMTTDLQKLKNTLAREFNGMTKDEAIECGRCVSCGKKVIVPGMNKFRDGLSAREYQISAFCQACQDQVFGDGGFEE